MLETSILSAVTLKQTPDFAGGGWRGKENYGLGNIFAFGPTVGLRPFLVRTGIVERKECTIDRQILPR